MKIFFAIFSIGSFLTTGVASAQQGSVTQPNAGGTLSATGKVIGPLEHPEPGIPVEVKGPSGSTYVFTDQDGRWSVYNLRAGKYEVQPAHAYKTPDSRAATFTVEGQSLLQRVFPTARSAIEMPDIKVNKESELHAQPK